MPEEPTWDNASVEPAPEPAAPVADPPVVDPPEPPAAVTPTLEPAPQLEAESAARESESQEVPEPAEVKDEDVQEGDTPEIKALPSGSSSRAWARRQFHDAAPVRTFLDFDKPIQEFGDDLYNRSQSRYREHVDDLVTRHADYASQKLFGLSVAEAKAKLANGQPATNPTASETKTTLATATGAALPLTEAELNQLTNEEVVQRLTAFQAAQTAAQEAEKQRLQSEFQKQVDDLKKQFDAVNGKVQTHEEQAQQAEINEQQQKLLGNVLTVVDDGIRTSGLEVKPDDPPKIANLKRAAVRLLDKQNIIAAFDAVPENAKLAQYAQEAIKRREYQNAFREEDNLKVRARAAFESVKQSPEVRAILDEIEAFANQSKGNSRAVNPIPPAPGSTAGVTIKPPTSWDEAQAAPNVLSA
jgi:hypothetical protein